MHIDSLTITTSARNEHCIKTVISSVRLYSVTVLLDINANISMVNYNDNANILSRYDVQYVSLVC